MNFLFLRRLLILSVLVIVPSISHAGTYNVPSATCPTIQSGVDAAHDGDTVIVADGTYRGNGNRDIDFHGKSLTVTSQNGPAKTIIDCGGYKTTDGSGNHRGFYIHSGEKNATISGFTVTNGYETSVVSGIPDSYGGGGIFNNNGGTVTLTNCIVSNNTAQYGGGVYIHNSNGKINFTNCAVNDNSAVDGGGIYNENLNYGSVILSDCTITGNIVGHYGGGVLNFNENSSLTVLTNCSFSSNRAGDNGGGIWSNNQSGMIILTNNLLYGDIGGEITNYTFFDASASYCDIQGGYPGTGNIDKDPLFLNAAIGDLHLQKASPCVGKGTSTGAPAADLDGRTRPSPPSMGAYELGSTLSVPARYPTIQAAIDAAKSDDTVLVADGTYTGDGNRDLDFKGKNITVKSVNGPAKAIIDCQGTSANQHRGFYFHNGEANTAEVDGFTIKNGSVHIPDDDGYPDGGGIDICSNSHATIKDCVISHNTADDGGGGICAFHSDPIISNCVVRGNTSSGGGGICILYGAGTISNCVIEGNTSGNYGGGIYAGNHTSNTNVTLNISIENCTVSNNIAGKGGGGIFTSGNAGASGNVFITNCVVWANVNGLFGGEVYNYPAEPAPLTVTYSDVQGGYPGTGNINADPLFVNAATGDLHLKLGSPCLGKGTPSGAPATDMADNPRPDPPSMGAYELAAVPATIMNFMLSPHQIAAPGPVVTANVSVVGNFTKVTVSPAPGSLGSASPTFNLLTNSGGGWAGSIPTAYLKLAKSNPITFIATGTRADGSTVQMSTPLIIGALPTLTLVVNSDKSDIPAGRTFSVRGAVLNLTAAAADAVTVTIPVPSHLTFVSSPDFTYDSTLNAVTWTGLLAKSGAHAISVEFQVGASTHPNTPITLNVTASATNFQSVTKPAYIVVDAPPAPLGIDIDTTGTAGQANGTAIIVSSLGTAPLQAIISPISGLEHAWLGVDHAYDASGGLLQATTDFSVGSLAAQLGVVGPGVSPTYTATFPRIGSQCNIGLRLTEKSAMLNIESIVYTAVLGSIGEKEGDSEEIIRLYSEFEKIPAFQDAAEQLAHPASEPWKQALQGAYIAHDFLSVNPNDLDTLAKYLSAKLKKDIDVKGFKKILTAIGRGRAILEIGQIVADEAIFVGLTGGADAEIVFTGSAVRHPDQLR